MPLPARFQTLFDDQTHRFAQCKNQRNGRSVVIEPVLAPIIHRRGQVEIPALHFAFAFAKNFFGCGAHGNGRHSGGALMAFCEPLKQTSTRSRSTSSGTAASDATVSTKS